MYIIKFDTLPKKFADLRDLLVQFADLRGLLVNITALIP